MRYTSYSLSGNYTTWKVGLDWHIIDQLRFRYRIEGDPQEFSTPAAAL